MGIRNLSGRDLTEAQVKALDWLAERHPNLIAWGFDCGALRVNTGKAGIDDWIIEPDGATWFRHAGRRVEQIFP